MDQEYRTVPQQLPNNNLNVYDLQNVTNFTDISIRHAFIKKVYGILTLQLSITIAVSTLFIFVEAF